MRDYLATESAVCGLQSAVCKCHTPATEEESLLSLMFQSYCNFTTAFINTRYVLLPHRNNHPLPLQVGTMVAPSPSKPPGEVGHVPPVLPLENSTILLQFHYRFSHLLLILLLQAYIWNTGNQSLYVANRRNVKPSSISLSRQTMNNEILGMKCVT